MEVDWGSNEFVWLLNQLKRGRVILFAGAGFSVGARNKFGNALPLGGTLAELLANEASMPYSGEALPIVCEAVEPKIGSNRMWQMFEDHYSVEAADKWYKTALSLSWRRIYTTNIDNLFQHFAPFDSGQKLRTIVRGQAPRERDQLLGEVQCVHLHGWVENRSVRPSFTPGDFAAHTANVDPWYQTLIDDITNCCCIFLGTQLEEPMLNHYLELREPKGSSRDAKEFRPRSFFVNRTISDIKKSSLQTRNIFSVEATGEEFFSGLANQLSTSEFTLPAVREREFPHLFGGGKRLSESVSGHFDQILPGQLPGVRPGTATRFFLGAEPTWDDIGKRRDGERQINSVMLEAIDADNGFGIVLLHGPAGSGKTTTLMRMAHDVADQGKSVFFARGVSRINWEGILKLAEDSRESGERIFVFVDLLMQHVESISRHKQELQLAKNITIVSADRTNAYARKGKRIRDMHPTLVRMTDLADADISSILDRLDEFGFLGVLKDKPRDNQEDAFRNAAKNQLLVAMKEATLGRDFDVILSDEFNELTHEAQLAYVICSIAVHQGAPGVYRKHLAPCIPKSSFSKGVVFADLLRGVLVAANSSESLLKPRHRLIGTWIATEVSPVDLRFEAVKSFLQNVSGHIVPNEIKRRSPPYLAYRGMVNADALYELFGGDSKAVIELYHEVQPVYKNDFLFWLQYGMAHIRARNLDIAENYLNQSLNIRPGSFQTLHHLGVLYLLQSQFSENPASMVQTAADGMDLLKDHMEKRGDEDSYGHHAYLTHVCRWYEAAGDIISLQEWEELRKVASAARTQYGLDDKIKKVADEVECAYLRRFVH